MDFPSLITADALKDLLPDPNYQVIQVVSQPQTQRMLIPGAARVLPHELVHGQPPAPGELPSMDRLNALFGRLGLSDEKIYVLADDEGGAWAGRLGWTLDMIGHSKWLYLNGGIHAWLAAGEEMTDNPTYPEPTEPNVTVSNKWRIQLEELTTQLDDPNLLVWDCRTPEEYAGIKQTAMKNGHIPGAVHLNWLDLVDHSNNAQIVADLEEQLADCGISKDKSLVVHCQTHHRSGFTYMVARLLGYSDVRAYPGSWAEWGNHPTTPVEIVNR